MQISDEVHIATVVTQTVWSLKECARYAEHADRSLTARHVAQLREAMSALQKVLEGKGNPTT